MDVGELRLIRDLSQTRIAVPHRLVQPREGAIGFTTERQHVGAVDAAVAGHGHRWCEAIRMIADCLENEIRGRKLPWVFVAP